MLFSRENTQGFILFQITHISSYSPNGLLGELSMEMGPPLEASLHTTRPDWMASLLGLLSQTQLIEGNEDRLIWAHHPSGAYSMKSFYLELMKNTGPCPSPILRKIGKDWYLYVLKFFHGWQSWKKLIQNKS